VGGEGGEYGSSFLKKGLEGYGGVLDNVKRGVW